MTDINPEDVPTLSDRTLLERTRVFFGHAAGNMFSMVVAGVLIAVVLRSAGVGDTVLMAWFSGLVLASVAVIFYEAWVHGQPLETVATARRVLRWRMALGAVVALMCGASVFMLPPGAQHAEAAFLFLIISTVVTVGAMSYAVLPAYYITLGLLGMAPMALYNGQAFVASGDNFHLLLSMMAVVWLVVVLLKARRVSSTAIEAIELNERLKDAVEEQRRTKEYMRHMAMHDELTGLANRRYFEQVFVRTRSLAEREGSRFGVMCIDLNDFKPVNDRHGHAVGDVLLQTVASRLQKAIRASDFCARVGGDEFALIIDKVNADTDLDGMAAKLRGVLGKPFLPLGISVATGASVGWALFPSDGNEMAPLLAVADKRMYAEKLAHRRAARARA
ncbi:MAG TPA: GGDEF domain-containing protein [Burkholderiaceae bacterium]|nr:GGDEF domain-containing protein [Burkholderiaceae bacterium]